jgi:hypothetical protein
MTSHFPISVDNPVQFSVWPGCSVIHTRARHGELDACGRGVTPNATLRCPCFAAAQPSRLHCAFLLRSRSSHYFLWWRSPQCCSPVSRRSAGSTRQRVASKKHPSSPFWTLSQSAFASVATARYTIPFRLRTCQNIHVLAFPAVAAHPVAIGRRDTHF